MLKFMYCIKDEKTGYGSLLLDDSDHTARRGFAYAVNNGSMMRFAAQDFSLYRMAEFNTVSGKIDPIVPPVFICNGTDLISRPSLEVSYEKELN